MKRPAIFFDRDNTLIVNDGYLGDPDGVRLVPLAGESIARARRAGFVIVVVSNQSGVARGMFDEQAVHRVNEQLDKLLREADAAAIIDRHDFCPFHPDATVEAYRQESDLRKPAPGMLVRSAEQLDIDLARSWMVGDSLRDIEAGKRAGCRTILVTDPTFPASPDAGKGDATPDYHVDTLAKAIEIIERASPPAGGVEQNPRTASAPTEPRVPASREQARGTLAADPSYRQEQLLGQILQEIRTAVPNRHADFSVPRLLAGIVQVLSLAVAVLGYLDRDPSAVPMWMMVAIYLQGVTIALLLMDR